MIRGTLHYLSMLVLVLLADTAVADESVLTSIERRYIDHQQTPGGVLKSFPVNHITPQFNKVTAAFDAEHLDTLVTNNQETSSTSYLNEQLKLSGYTFSPYMALSLRSIGVGIAGEFGQKHLRYEQLSSSGSTVNYKEQSMIDYTGVGIYVYKILSKRSRRYRLTLVGGTKLLNVKHRARSSSSYSSSYGLGEERDTRYFGASEYIDQDWETLKYTIQRAEIGLNLRYQLSHSLAIVPWVHMMTTNVNQIEDQLKLASQGSNLSFIQNSRRYGADVELFWRNKNPLTYGVDVAIKHKRIELHIGGALGFLLNDKIDPAEQGLDLEDDLSFSFGLSYDFRG